MHAQLNQHPDVRMSSSKEPHFLSRHDKTLDDYRRVFPDAQGYKYRGESSTGYLLQPGVITKIQQFMPDSRFILMFRNPVDRAWSHYWHIRGGSGAESAPFREAFLRSKDEPLTYAMYNRHYQQTGFYARWLQNYLDAFGPDRVHVLILEELNANTEMELHDLCSFLEIPDFASPSVGHLNRSRIARFPIVARTEARLRRLASRTVMKPLSDQTYGQLRAQSSQIRAKVRRLLGSKDPPRIGPEDREWVAGFYRAEVSRLREMTGRELAGWTDFPG
jgi:hypothetical protein